MHIATTVVINPPFNSCLFSCHTFPKRIPDICVKCFSFLPREHHNFIDIANRRCSCFYRKRAVVRAFKWYRGGILFQSLSPHLCLALGKCFIHSLVVTWCQKNNALRGKSKTSNGEQSDFCDLQLVFLKPSQLQIDHCFTTWLQI